MEKLQQIPAETLRNILNNQVDLEIRLKHRELKLTEEEIGKCEAQMLALRQFFEVPNEISFREEPNEFTLKYYEILNRSLSVNYTKLQQQLYARQNHVPAPLAESIPTEQSHSYRTRSTTSSLRPSIGGLALQVSGCIYRRTDGIIVRLTCPGCQRSNFSSAQGFLNHNRIAHNKEFASQDEAALKCGEVLPDAYQDEEGLASLAVLKEKHLDLSSNLTMSELFFDGFAKSVSGTPKYSVDQRRKSTSGRGHRRANSFIGGSNDFKGADFPCGLTFGSEELMSKLIQGGVTEDSEQYKVMVEEFRRTVPNSHLFADEEEVVEAEAALLKIHTPLASRPMLRASSVSSSISTMPILLRTEGLPSAEFHEARPHSAKSELKKTGSVASETGGKYENRLRRRRPKSDTSEADGVRRKKGTR